MQAVKVGVLSCRFTFLLNAKCTLPHLNNLRGTLRLCVASDPIHCAWPKELLIPDTYVAVTFYNKEELLQTCVPSKSQTLAWADFLSVPGPALVTRGEGHSWSPGLERVSGSGFLRAAASPWVIWDLWLERERSLSDLQGELCSCNSTEWLWEGKMSGARNGGGCWVKGAGLCGLR